MRPLKYFFYIILQKKAMKRLFPILILLLSQVSCTNQYVQSSQEISESVRAKLALITKSACDDLIKGIVVADVESFLLGQLNLQKEEIDSINRIDLSADAYFYVVILREEDGFLYQEIILAGRYWQVVNQEVFKRENICLVMIGYGSILFANTSTIVNNLIQKKLIDQGIHGLELSDWLSYHQKEKQDYNAEILIQQK